MTALKIITAPSGARFSVAAEHADRFQALVNDLEAAGYPVKADQSGGYNKRNIAGTSTPSQHSFGRAIDVNWNENARGKPGAIPQDVALELAKKHGMTWGGTWKNRDDMHFEVADTAPRPMGDRGLTSFAGMTAPKADTPAPMPFSLAAPVTGADPAVTPAAAPAAVAGLNLPFGLSLGKASADLPDPLAGNQMEMPRPLASMQRKPVDMTSLMQLAATKRRGVIG